MVRVGKKEMNLIQSYETAYAMCKRALRRGRAREEAEATEVMLRKAMASEDAAAGEVLQLPRSEVVDLMKSLAKNAAISYMYLAGVETAPGVKTHCFNKSAEVSRKYRWTRTDDEMENRIS